MTSSESAEKSHAQPDEAKLASNVTKSGVPANLPVLITLTTVFSYTIAYAWEYTYASALKIPRELISVTPANLMIAAVGLATWLTTTTIAVDIMSLANRALDRRTRVARISLAVVCAGSVYLTLRLPRDREGHFSAVPLIVAVISGIFLVAEFLSSFFKAVLPAGGRAESSAQLESDPGPAAFRSVVEELISRASPTWTGLVIGHALMQRRRLRILIITLAFAFWSEYYVAQSQEDFWIIEGPTECVVLRIYGDTMIAAPLNRSTHTYSKTIMVRKLIGGGEPPTTLMHLEKVGPLKRQQ